MWRLSELGESGLLTLLRLNHHPIFPVFPALGAWVMREQLRSQRREGGLGQDHVHCSSSWTHPQNPCPPAPPRALQELGHHAQSPRRAILWLMGTCMGTGSAPPWVYTLEPIPGRETVFLISGREKGVALSISRVRAPRF